MNFRPKGVYQRIGIGLSVRELLTEKLQRNKQQNKGNAICHN